jgi:SH3 domain protein
LGVFVRRTVGILLLAACPLAAPAEDAVRYVTDQITIVLRDAPSAESASRGVVTSGARVAVLARDEPSGYVRVRTADGREGWMLARHLDANPVARERVQRAEKDLAAAQAELKKLQADHARLVEDFKRISGGEPLASREVREELDRAREQLRQNQEEVSRLREQYDQQRASQRTLLLGGGLVALGALLALLVRWLWPKRRWGDL